MSTGLECEIIHYDKGEWYVILQNGDCPVRCWDWREYATAYGPFPTGEKAREHLRDNHANPGGHSMDGDTPDPGYKNNPVYRALITDAKERRKRERDRPFGSVFRDSKPRPRNTYWNAWR